MYSQVAICFNPSVRDLCCKPYPNHKKGCPNFGKRDDCPPHCELITELIDVGKPMYAVYNKFNIGSHAKRMREKHPEWSDRQVYCCLYWQPKARKQLKENILKFKKEFKDLFIVKNPEASGIDVTKTMLTAGIKLEWPPKKWAYQVILAGTPLNGNKQ